MMGREWGHKLSAGAFLLAAIGFLSPAAAQTHPAPTQSPSVRSYTFALPYVTGAACFYRQALQLEARTGEYGPHDLVMDIRRIVTYSVTRTAEDAVSVRVLRLQQRGDAGGRRLLRDESGSKPFRETYSSEDDWVFRVPFRA